MCVLCVWFRLIYAFYSGVSHLSTKNLTYQLAEVTLGTLFFFCPTPCGVFAPQEQNNKYFKTAVFQDFCSPLSAELLPLFFSSSVSRVCRAPFSCALLAPVMADLAGFPLSWAAAQRGLFCRMASVVDLRREA
ncbi:unnamed protein product [Ectocarpus fasciculatus]